MTSVDDLLSELRALDAKAQRAPWSIEHANDSLHRAATLRCEGWFVASFRGGEHGDAKATETGEHDAALVAALRNNLLTLLSTIEQLQKVINRGVRHAGCNYYGSGTLNPHGKLEWACNKCGRVGIAGLAALAGDKS